jgi:hypothetical protein
LSSHLTKNTFIVRFDLGEQSCIVSKGLLDNPFNRGQRQRWSLMTVLYLGVRYKYIWEVQVVLIWMYFRCAALEYYSLCMFARLVTIENCAEKSSDD